MLLPKNGRDYGFDNLRALLMIFVVFAHLLEIRAPFPLSEDIYRVIYSFHMPVFLFLCGWFARFDRTKLLFGLLIPYFLLQAAYIYFQRWLYGTDVLLQFTTPYWLLWFLLALFFYHLLLPLYDVASPRSRILLWCGVLLLSLLAGYDPTVGYSMTLSRFLVFQPWFLLGYYARRTEPKPVPILVKTMIVLTLAFGIVVLWGQPITKHMLYGSYSYETLQYHAGIRVFLAAMALLWILFFMVIVKPFLNVRIPLLTRLGQNTLSAFLLHGFFVKFIGYRYPQLLENPVMFLVITAAILLLTANPITATAFRCLLPDFWIKKWASRQQPPAA